MSFNGEQTVKIKANGNVYLNAPITALSANGKLIIQYGLGQNTASNNKRIYIRSPIHLQSGNNLSKKRGSDGIEETYIVITQLGTFTDTTTIPSPMTLQGMHTGLTSSYALGADIEANSTISWNNGNGFFPIGSPNGQFRGKFDGLGHSIKGLSINRQTTDNVGFFANTFKSKISNLALQDISISGKNSVGGLAGGDYQSYTQGINDFSNISITGQIVGEMNVGGFLGFARYSSVSNSYSLASVQSTQTTGKVGGFFGHNHEYSKIINSYSAGLISGGDSRGGLIGGALFGPTNLITNSFWDTQVSEQSNSFGGLGKSTEAMKSLNTYSNAGWNSSPNTGTWKVSDGKYPVLPWQNPLNSSPLQLQPINVLSFSENLPIMSLIGEFNATDPDTNASLSFSLVDGNGSSDNPLFFLETNGSLATLTLFDFETNSSTYSIRVRVQDEYNASIEGNFSILLTNQVEDFDQDGTEDYFDLDDDNDGFADTIELAYGSDPRNSNSVANAPPHSISLNNSNILENQPIGTLITDFNATDPDANATLTFSISGPNAPLFSIDSNGTLYTNTIFDFENNASSYSLLIRVTDQHSAFLQVSKNIVLKNSNESPESITPSNTSFYENQPISTLIGDFNATDPDANSTFTYSISGSNAHLFNIDPNGSLFTNAIFDFENNASLYSLLLRATDEHNASLEISQDIVVKNSNEPPSTLALSNTTFFENPEIGILVGSITATDPDANTTLSYSFSDGNGSHSNPLFTIDSNGSLKTAQPFDFETNATTYLINVRVTDEQNASIDKTFNLSLQNIIEDLDGDGIEDHYDLDDDGDGFSDADEIANNSDPRDAKSILNQPPSTIDLNHSSIAENMPIGSIIGQFSANDPDANALLSFYLVHTNAYQPIVSANSNSSSAKLSDGTTAESNQTALPSPGSELIKDANTTQPIVGDHNSTPVTHTPFILDPNGTLRTTQTLDFENGPSQYSIKVRVSDEWNASIEKEFSIQILDLDENAPIVSLLGESIITLLSTDPWIDPGATWKDQKDGNGTIFSQNDLNQTHPTLEEWVQNGKKLPEGMMFTGGTPWFDESTGQNRDDKEVYNMLFAIKTGEYQLTYQYRDQAGNPSNLATRTLLIIHPTKPIVQTLTASIDENGSVQFGAEIRSGAKMELIETGIHYGTDQIFSEFNQIDLSLSTTTDQYFSAPFKPQGNNQIFYRAYARNKAGTSYGSVKTLTLPSDSNTTLWWSGSIEEQGGWQTSPWFGSFRRYPQGWIFHADLNWLYAYAGESGDVWLWSQDHGWLWTGPDVYPHLFNHGTANWFYFLKKQDGIPMFYDYTTEAVK